MIEPTDNEAVTAQKKEDFSLVLGGPLYQLSLRLRMMQPSMELLPRRIVGLTVITWVPLAVLTALSGTLLGRVGVPFLFDVDAHVKFLISLPLMIGAELLVHRRLRGVVAQFVERGLVVPEDREKFDALIAQAMRLRNSILVEVLLLAIALTGGTWLWRNYVTLSVATWYAVPGEGALGLTWAGSWYAYVSLPIVRFILLRWYYRLFIWYVFLWRVSRLRLDLNPMHPDRVGGLGFLGGTVHAFAPVLMAQTAFLAGVIGNQIWHVGQTLPHFKFEIAGAIAFLMLVVLTPLTFFAIQLNRARRVGLRRFGLLATRYVTEFRQKWLESDEPREPLLGTADLQSLADMSNSYEVVRTTRMLPFDRGLLIRLGMVLVAPLLPLTLTMIPFEDLFDRVIKLIL